MNTNANIEGHKKFNLLEIEKLECCKKGMNLYADYVKNHLKFDSIIEKLKETAQDNPFSLAVYLQALEWNLSQIVQFTASLMQDAGKAIEQCHALRGGNENVCRQMNELNYKEGP